MTLDDATADWLMCGWELAVAIIFALCLVVYGWLIVRWLRRRIRGY